MIKAVIFDLDDTLVVDEAVSKETFFAVAERARRDHGADPSEFSRVAMDHARSLWQAGPCHSYCRAIGISAFECLWGAFATGTPDVQALREWALEFRTRVFDAALRHQMIEHADGASELAEYFASERRRRQRLMPDALETLVRLQPTFRLGLLTNGAPDLQREKIAASGLGKLFQSIAVSGEHGIGKPRPEIFEIVARELGVPVPTAVMGVISLERDIAGARNAGRPGVGLPVAGSEEHAVAEPDCTITGLAELPAVLDQFNAVPAA